MAAGLGTRMRSATPKHFHPLLGRRMVDWVIEVARELGAFRADVTGAGPAVYGLFHHRAAAEAASRELAPVGGTWVRLPAWYV